MTEVLIATDADAVFAEVEAALVDETTSIVRVRDGAGGRRRGGGIDP